ncbi:MAG: polysaccharide deacetylase [Armatimonadetes bacterium JP3_11]|jgi:peptidoglycan/xylan/chitin deacetylase (PgdA/CDA1 family)|nr:MAG: polysaccharide deacetylase [Armatimonadetes bacterium CP1_7O]OYT75258.1 MAG: polysaccharide deacetylase [Armatimonadetes bacterium JP3_11]RMH10524.1 MAG: polysaccharide deacetylase family protein [Armatimonadota bacterium]
MKAKQWLLLFVLAVGLSGCRNASPEKRVESPTDPYWLQAEKEVYKSLPELLAQDATEQQQKIALRKLIRGNPNRKWIALTFDDGPHPLYTPKLVAILNKYQVKATFFVVGKMAEQYPELVHLLQQSGHAIGNHTYHHVNLTRLTPEQIAVEIKACGKVIQNLTGQAPHLFRPPGGDYNQTVAEIANALGYWLILWTDDPGDYARPNEATLKQRLLDQLSNGGIILLHDGVPETIDLLPQLLDYLKREGYEIVLVDEMLPQQKSQ